MRDQHDQGQKGSAKIAEETSVTDLMGPQPSNLRFRPSERFLYSGHITNVPYRCNFNALDCLAVLFSQSLHVLSSSPMGVSLARVYSRSRSVSSPFPPVKVPLSSNKSLLSSRVFHALPSRDTGATSSLCHPLTRPLDAGSCSVTQLIP